MTLVLGDLRELEPSIVVDTINSSVSPVPLVSVSLAASSTLSGQPSVTLQNSVVFDSNTVNTLITQQSATNATLSESEKIKQGIIPGVAGATLQQVSRPGYQLKPGSAEFIQAKINMGMKCKAAISNNMLTGNYGVRTVNDLYTNTSAQVSAVRGGLQSATVSLANSGIISGLESATKIGGIALAVSVFGNSVLSGLGSVGNVLTLNSSTIVNSIKSNVSNAVLPALDNIKSLGTSLTNVSNMISSGNFATALADNFKNGLDGIASSIAGAASGFVNKIVGGIFGKSPNFSIEQLLGQLRSSAQSAYLMAERAFGTLKPNEPNYLSEGGQVARELTAAEKKMYALGAMYEESSAARVILVNARLAALKNSNAETQEALREAESNVAKIDKKYANVAGEYLTSSTSSDGFFAALKRGGTTAAADIKQTATSVYGALGSFVTSGKSAIIDARDSAQKLFNVLHPGSATETVRKNLEQLSDTTKLTGNLVGNFTTSINNIGASVGAALTNNSLVSGIKNALGSFGGSSGMIKTPKFASNTDRTVAAVASKTGQLIDSNVCPLPPSFSDEVTVNRTPNEQIKLQRESLARITELQAQKQTKELEIDKLNAIIYSNYNPNLRSNPGPEKLFELNAAKNELLNIQKQLTQAEEAYTRLVQAA